MTEGAAPGELHSPSSSGSPAANARGEDAELEGSHAGVTPTTNAAHSIRLGEEMFTPVPLRSCTVRCCPGLPGQQSQGLRCCPGIPQVLHNKPLRGIVHSVGERPSLDPLFTVLRKRLAWPLRFATATSGNGPQNTLQGGTTTGESHAVPVTA